MARQWLDKLRQRPPSRGSVSVNYTRMHAYKFAVRAWPHVGAARRAARLPPAVHHGRMVDPCLLGTPAIDARGSARLHASEKSQ
jgi:hypothetical protein